MKTYNDYLSAPVKEKFIYDAIQEYKLSKLYCRAIVAQAYYERDNEAIIARTTFLEQYGVKNSKIKFFKLRNGFLKKTVDQEVQYLLGNGVTLEDEIKERLGEKFDRALQEAGWYAKIAGVSYGFWNVDRLIIFKATEYFQLLDEQSGDIMMGIRFWQLDEKKPLYVEVYEQDGFTCYRSEDEGMLNILRSKTAYKTKVRMFTDSEDVIDTDNYPCIPVFPLYANNTRTSVLNDGLKEDIDAYDFLISDIVDGALQLDGIYWIIRNYLGNDERQLLAEIQAYKIARNDGDSDASAEANVLETPYKAKETALYLLEKKMYKETMTLNTEELSGGNLTNVAIKVAMTDFDLKVDQFEYYCIDFVQNIVELLGYEDVEPMFKRRTLVNDTETLQSIYTMREDIDHETALMLNPMIPDSELEEIMDRFEAEDLSGGGDTEETEETAMYGDGEADDMDTDEDMEEEPNKNELDALFSELDDMIKELR